MIITLSRQLGSEGDAIAARVAAATGFRLIDRVYIHAAALAAGVPAALLQKLMYEGARSMASEILDSLGTPQGQRSNPPAVSSPLLGVFAPLRTPADISIEEAARSVGLVIKDVASQDRVLILGQGGQMWLRGYANACHVQIVAPLDLRIERVARAQKLAPAAAKRLIRSSDQARSDYLARYHDARWQDPLLYHLVINTGLTSIEAAVSLVIHAAQGVSPAI